MLRPLQISALLPVLLFLLCSFLALFIKNIIPVCVRAARVCCPCAHVMCVCVCTLVCVRVCVRVAYVCMPVCVYACARDVSKRKNDTKICFYEYLCE
jgi:hypothetical protein